MVRSFKKIHSEMLVVGKSFDTLVVVKLSTSVVRSNLFCVVSTKILRVENLEGNKIFLIMWDDFHNQLKSHDKHKIDFNVRCVPEYPRAEERAARRRRYQY